MSSDRDRYFFRVIATTICYLKALMRFGGW